ncbi:hypothetical protein MK805_05480 [Shimazuella sp. AN120528]|nr:hypothetical protein [Shimazuella soli]
MVHTLLVWLTIILDWLSKRDWRNWSMWAAVGQTIGAIATFWTARIALKLVREAKRQEKETKRREKEALEPELYPKVAIKDNGNEKKIIHFTLANIKPTPAYIADFIFINHLPEIEPYSYEMIETGTPERVVYGEVSNTKVPLSYLKRLITENDQEEGFFKFQFTLATDQVYTFSVYLKIGNVSSEWYVYLANQDVTKVEILQTGTHVHYIHNRIVNMKRHNNKVS